MLVVVGVGFTLGNGTCDSCYRSGNHLMDRTCSGWCFIHEKFYTKSATTPTRLSTLSSFGDTTLNPPTEDQSLQSLKKLSLLQLPRKVQNQKRKLFTKLHLLKLTRNTNVLRTLFFLCFMYHHSICC